MEAEKYRVLPLDGICLNGFMSDKLNYAPDRTATSIRRGSLTCPPGEGGAPPLLNRPYTITAEVEIPAAGADGVLVTDGWRFGGYGLYSRGDRPASI